MYSPTDAAEFRPDDEDAAAAGAAITVCEEVFELIEVRFELLNWKLEPAAAEVALRVFGVGGSGELAWRFSGLGEPRFPTELVQLELEACREWA